MANRWKYDTKRYPSMVRNPCNEIEIIPTDKNVIYDAVLLWIKTEIPVSLLKRLRINEEFGSIRIHNDPAFSDANRSIKLSFREECVIVMQDYNVIGKVMYCDPKMFDSLLKFLYKVHNG